MNRCFLFGVVLMLGIVPETSADILIKQQTTTITGSGKREKTETEETIVWIAADRMASLGQKTSMILRLDKNVAWSIDNEKKTWTEIPLTLLDPSTASGQADDPGTGLPAALSSMMKMNVTIDPTEETKRIRNWNCRRYNQVVEISFGKTTSQLWATEDIRISPSLLKAFSSALMAQNSTMAQLAKDMMREAEKIKGYVVLSSSESKVMGQQTRSTMEVLEMKEQDPPEGIYEPPAKFKKKKFE